ncbi:DUF2786 domain-containing protein [Actinomadura litoris]|uniref:DUF2786 domain-containing protein n=1 Tax=Actinomadura litoris TaxID=2678616 RepID=UPI001FA80643|nr:DUF2786 domain-containing protein [Actinomadura litoris]
MAGRDYKKIIKGLLAKAGHPNTPRAEAEAAAAKAAELMMREGIDESQVRQEEGRAPEEIEIFKLQLPGDHGTVLVKAFNPIARAMGAETIVIDSDLVMVGTVSLLNNLDMILQVVEIQMYNSANAAGEKYKDKLKAQHPTWSENRVGDATMSWVYDYFRGYGMGVAEKIRKKRQTIIDESPSNALVLRKDDIRIKEAFNKQWPSWSPLGGHSISDHGAFGEGHAAGQRADLGDGHVAGRMAGMLNG